MTSPYGTGVVGTYSPSSNTKIDALAWYQYKWGSNGAGTAASITYSFPTSGSVWSSDYRTYLENEPFNRFRPFDADQQAAAKRAIAAWAEVANVKFTQVSDTAGDMDVGDIRFGNSGSVMDDPTAAAWTYPPFKDSTFTYPENGDIWVAYEYSPNLQLGRGQFGYSTLLHEIGHTLGLDHPFADGYGETTLPIAQDNQRYTIMSYTNYSGATIEAYGPMLYDILAIQYIYGANMTTRAGNTVYTFGTAQEYLECIWDGGGRDTINLSHQVRGQVLSLNAGTFSSIGLRTDGHSASGNVAIAFNCTIEDALGGSGHDRITGNGVANWLRGGSGNDTLSGGSGNDQLDGGAGIDSMSGGTGNDLYYVNHTSDRTSEVGGQGSDTVKSTVSYTLLNGAYVEVLQLVGGNLNGTGNSLANTLVGSAGNNVLKGGGGADTMRGGNGNDTYYITNSSSPVVEASNAGIDIVMSSIDYTLVANVEKLTLSGSGDIDGTGNTLNNVITGNVGDNTLYGGAGADTLVGGTGNDTYRVNSTSDVVTEAAGGGLDTIVSSMSYNLTRWANVEKLTLAEGATSAVLGIGNARNNDITGNSDGNSLKGGDGNDTLRGGDGADSLNGEDGHDRLYGGTGTDTLTGGTGNDFLVGGDGADLLDGGTGRDTFDYNALSEAGDTIIGFTVGLGKDVLDLRDLLASFGDPDPFTNGFVEFVIDESDTLVNVDANGGMDNGVLLATLQGAHLTQADTNNYLV